MTGHPGQTAEPADGGVGDAGGSQAPLPVTIHEPVMVREVLAHLAPHAGAVFLDGTTGTGGHALDLARRLLPGGTLVAIDLDPSALEVAGRRIAEALAPAPVVIERARRDGPARPSTAGPEGLRLVLVHGNFAEVTALARASGFSEPEGAFDGILLDLGLSSFALDDPERGFSFQQDGPLDMRMSPEMRLTAADVVNRYEETELRRIFREEGEERWARRIAAAIVRRRAERPIQTTGDLADIVAGAVPHPRRHRRTRRRIHPATRVFMSIRTVVNDEEANLRAVLPQMPRLLRPGGRAAVLAYHSREDRPVKWGFRALADEGAVRIITKKPLRPSEDERRANRRSRSARLRVIERPADDAAEADERPAGGTGKDACRARRPEADRRRGDRPSARACEGGDQRDRAESAAQRRG